MCVFVCVSYGLKTHCGNVARLNVDAIAIAVIRGGRYVIHYIWLVVFGAWIFLSPTSITLAVLSPTDAE